MWVEKINMTFIGENTNGNNPFMYRVIDVSKFDI